MQGTSSKDACTIRPAEEEQVAQLLLTNLRNVRHQDKWQNF